MKQTFAVIILLADQPFISQVLLQSMMQTFAEGNSPIVACDYGNQLGVPILFDKSFFPELLKLQGDRGAKSFLQKYTERISIVDFKEGLFDIDTPEDLLKLQTL